VRVEAAVGRAEIDRLRRRAADGRSRERGRPRSQI